MAAEAPVVFPRNKLSRSRMNTVILRYAYVTLTHKSSTESARSVSEICRKQYMTEDQWNLDFLFYEACQTLGESCHTTIKMSYKMSCKMEERQHFVHAKIGSQHSSSAFSKTNLQMAFSCLEFQLPTWQFTEKLGA